MDIVRLDDPNFNPSKLLFIKIYHAQNGYQICHVIKSKMRHVTVRVQTSLIHTSDFAKLMVSLKYHTKLKFSAFTRLC